MRADLSFWTFEIGGAAEGAFVGKDRRRLEAREMERKLM
jgi:hypothetical protein